MDKASQALAENLPEGIPNTYAARSAHTNVPISTLGHRKRGRRSREDKAIDQRYLYPYEENAVSDFLTRSAALGQPVRVKYMPAIAFSATRHRPEADRPLKPPHYNWAKRFETRRTELIARTNKPQDWNRYNIYDKVIH
ncbi:hypothetical protein BU23DRAFT_372845, partial [Bimuria novae-zelandiae CBS 107.79]